MKQTDFIFELVDDLLGTDWLACTPSARDNGGLTPDAL